MIRGDDGQRYGTAAEVAKALGVTEAAVRNWARRDGLPAVRMTDDAGRPEVRYPLDQAAEIGRASCRERVSCCV